MEVDVLESSNKEKVELRKIIEAKVEKIRSLKVEIKSMGKW